MESMIRPPEFMNLSIHIYHVWEWRHNKILTFYYDNGKSYTAKGVTAHSLRDSSVVYTQETYDRGIKSEAIITVPTHDVIGFIVKDGDEVTIKKLKPCATMRFGIDKT